MIFLLVRWATSLYVLFLVSFSPVLSGDDAKDDSFLFLDFFPFHRVHTHICLRYVLYPTHFYLTSLHITIHLLILLTSPLSPHQPHPIYPHLSLSSSFVYFEISRIPLDMFQDGAVRAQYSHPQVTTRQTQTTRLHIITLIILHYSPRLHLDKYSNTLPNTISTFVSSFTT